MPDAFSFAKNTGANRRACNYGRLAGLTQYRFHYMADLKGQSVTPIENFSSDLVNGWVANFEYRGEFKMGYDYRGLGFIINGDKEIDYLKEKIVLVNDYNGDSIKKI